MNFAIVSVILRVFQGGASCIYKGADNHGGTRQSKCLKEHSSFVFFSCFCVLFCGFENKLNYSCCPVHQHIKCISFSVCINTIHTYICVYTYTSMYVCVCKTLNVKLLQGLLLSRLFYLKIYCQTTVQASKYCIFTNSIALLTFLPWFTFYIVQFQTHLNRYHTFYLYRKCPKKKGPSFSIIRIHKFTN